MSRARPASEAHPVELALATGAEHAPLAARMRPASLDEVVGQQHLVGERGALRRMLESGHLASMLLWGAPGVGKTTLARLLSNAVAAPMETLSATSSGVADVRAVIARARGLLQAGGSPSVLFIDEIHRFNKAQQDALLPHVEEGVVTLIGATTENPYFEVNSPLLSRLRVFRLEPLSEDEVGVIVDRALQSPRGLAGHVGLDPEARQHLVSISAGDARAALNILESAAAIAAGQDIDLELVESAAQQRVLTYEDPKFIARRLIILASEDIGNADPRGLQVAVAAAQALDWVGVPEGQYALAQATCFLATAPKSNRAGQAYWAAVADVREHGSQPVPRHLLNAPVRQMRHHGIGVGYRYPHDYEGADVEQRYLPDLLAERRYYHPSDQGYERLIGERMDALLEARRKAQASGGPRKRGRKPA